MPWTNYHSHSHYCDGKEAPEKHIQAAIAKNFLAFGCSSHATVPFENPWAIKEEDKSAYCADILSLKKKYQDQIQIYLSLEVDYIPDMVGPTAVGEEMGLEYTVGSVHFVDQHADGSPWGIDGTRMEFARGLEGVFGQDIERAVSRYYALTRQMLEEDCPTILGHMDKIKMHNKEGGFFQESDAWYQKQVLQTLETAKASGVIIEVNTRGLYKKKTPTPYPSPWVLEAIHDMGIPITLNSDSHHPEDIDKYYTEMAKLLLSIGYKELHVLLDNEWQVRSFSENGIIS